MKRGNKLWKRVLTAALSLAVAGACLPFGALAEGTQQEKTAYFYVVVPGGNAESHNVSQWMYLGRESFVPNKAVNDLEKAGSTEDIDDINFTIPTENGEVIKNAYADALAKDLGIEADDLGEINIAYEPFRVVYASGATNNGKETIESGYCYHVDMLASITTQNYVNINFLVQKPGASAYEPYAQTWAEKGEEYTIEAGFIEATKAANGNTYVFDGWYFDAGCNDKANNPFNVTESVTLYGRYVPSASYTVRHYKQNGDETYSEDTESTETIENAIVESTVTATQKKYDGYTFNETKSTTSGTVTSDNKLVLELYYDRGSMTEIVTVTGFKDVYDGKAHAITVNGVPEDSTITYTVGETQYNENPEFVNVGTYTVTVNIQNGNYLNYTASATVTITPRPVTYTAVSVEKVYDGTALGCAASATLTEGTLAEGDELKGLSVSGSQQEVGSSPNYLNSITIKNSAGDDVTANYAVTLVNGTLTITAAPATPAPATATPAPTPKDEHPEIAQAIKDGTWGKADPTPTPSADPAVKTTAARVPQTGDTSNPVLWVVAMVAALAAFAGVVILRRRSNKD